MLDDRAILETSVEMRDLARVIKAALGVLIAYWNQMRDYPPAHPYRQAVRMIVRYLEHTYGV
jgi:hypothetical protein